MSSFACLPPCFQQTDHHTSQGIPSLGRSPKSPPLNCWHLEHLLVPGTVHSSYTTWDGVPLASRVVSSLVPILGSSAKQKQRQTCRRFIGHHICEKKWEEGQEEARQPSDGDAGLAPAKGEEGGGRVRRSPRWPRSPEDAPASHQGALVQPPSLEVSHPGQKW